MERLSLSRLHFFVQKRNDTGKFEMFAEITSAQQQVNNVGYGEKEVHVDIVLD